MLTVLFTTLQLIFSKNDEVGVVLFGTEGISEYHYLCVSFLSVWFLLVFKGVLMSNASQLPLPCMWPVDW